GRRDTFVTFRDGKKARQEEDRNGDGEIDAIFEFDARERVAREQIDADFDGRFETVAEYVDGEQVRRITDSSGRGTPERVEHYASGRLVRVELDEDRDGRVDLWNFYDPEGRLEKQEQDRSGDGKVDTWVTLDPATGKETRVLSDRNGDGRVDSWRTN